MTSRPGPKGSPRMTIAGLTLATATKAITVKEALLKSGYQEDEISRARIKAASKRKCRIVNDVLSKKKKAKCSEYYVNARIKNKSNPTSTSTSSPREASSVHRSVTPLPFSHFSYSQTLPVIRGLRIFLEHFPSLKVQHAWRLCSKMAAHCRAATV